jgi:hypothetical protein
MNGFLKGCARGALGLGAAALLLAGVPAHAGPASPGSVIGSAAASRDSEPLLMAQSTAQQEEAAQLEKRRQEEQRKQMQEKDLQKSKKEGMKTRGPMPKSAAPVPEAAPPAPGSKRFGAGVIRHGDPGDSGEVE